MLNRLDQNVEMKTNMENIIERNNIKVFGEGEQTILFAHGFGCDQNMWQYISPFFSTEYRIVQFDYVGAGKSDIAAYSSVKYKNLHGYKQDILDIIQVLNLENVIFIGHSVSGMIGMLAAIEQPSYFKDFIMIGPSPRYLNDSDGYYGGFEEHEIQELLTMMEMNFTGWASYLAQQVMDQTKSHLLTEELEDSFVSIEPKIAREFAEVTFTSDYRNRLSNMPIPTFIIQCTDDSIVPIEVGQYLQSHLPNSTLTIMEAIGHYPHISQPEETARLIKNYLT